MRRGEHNIIHGRMVEKRDQHQYHLERAKRGASPYNRVSWFIIGVIILLVLFVAAFFLIRFFLSG